MRKNRGSYSVFEDMFFLLSVRMFLSILTTTISQIFDGHTNALTKKAIKTKRNLYTL